MRSRLLALAGGAALVLVAPARTSAAPPAGAYAGYSIIFLSLGNVGTQHMSLYGYARKTTPRLDEFSRDALVFEEAFSPASWTLPVAASIFTALYPYSHKVIHRVHENALDPGIRTLPEVLRDNGYRTAAFTGGLDYNKVFGTMRGFQETDSNPNFTRYDATLKQAKTWLRRHGREKFFLFIHGYDTHCPFTPPDSVRGTFSDLQRKGVTVDNTRCVRGTSKPRRGRFETFYSNRCPEFPRTEACRNDEPEKVYLTATDLGYLRDLYDEALLAADAKAGEFLVSLDRSVRAKTIIVILAEHGEMFAKHGRFGRAGSTRGTLYDDVVHIPLVVSLPGIRGRRIPGLAELGDLAPTIARLVGVRIPHRIQGRDLSPLIWDRAPVHQYVFAGLPFMWLRPTDHVMSINESIRDRDWKLIREVSYPRDGWRSALRRMLRLPPKAPKEAFELFHVGIDPEESVNLVVTHPEVTQRLRKELAAWGTETRSFNPRTPKTQPVPKQLLDDAMRRGYW